MDPVSTSTRSARALRAVLALGALGALVSMPRTAGATTIFEYPDNGSEQMGRGGAWVARASDPLAAFYNPAGLAGQQTRLTLQSNFSLQSTCYTRQLAANDNTDEALADPKTGQFPQVCGDKNLQIGPQLAFTYRLSDRVGIGFMPIIGPSAAAGKQSWPTFMNDANGKPQPAPQRYLLLNSNLLLLTPTIGVGVEVVDNLRLGASFQWGIASFDFTSGAAGTNGAAIAGARPEPSTNDVTAELKGHDYFIPGFTLGGLWSATDSLDVAGWYKWSAPISTTGDIQTQANYFTTRVANGDTSQVKYGDTSQTDCGTGMPNVTACGSGNNANVRLVIPMEAKVGLRFHKLRGGVPAQAHLRDPMSQDIFDVETDLTWANNSANDYLQIRFPGDANGEGVIPINGTPGYAPPNSDVRHHFKDVVGIRVGGDWNALPDQLAVRAGGFFETNGQDMTYQNLDIIGAQKFGFALGGTYRIHFGQRTSALEISLGLMHVFYADEDNSSPTAAGLNGIAGTNCNPVEMPSKNPNCMNGVQKYRTNWPVNLGTITNSVNVLNLGLSYRF